MASKGSSKKGKGQRSSSGPERHNGLAGCSCKGCLRMAETSSRMADRDPFDVRFSDAEEVGKGETFLTYSVELG
jgi:hypothetical protein